MILLRTDSSAYLCNLLPHENAVSLSNYLQFCKKCFVALDRVRTLAKITITVSLSAMPAMQHAPILPPNVDTHAASNMRVLKQDLRQAGDEISSADVPLRQRRPKGVPMTP